MIQMGLFGDKDAADVPDNPFYVAPDTYQCVLTEAKVVEKNDQSGSGLAFKWVIQDADSDYEGNQIQDWKNIYPDVTDEELTPNMRKDNSRLKGRLLEMGVPENAMNSLLENLDDLVGIEAYITVVETKDKHDATKVYSNIKSLRLNGDE